MNQVQVDELLKIKKMLLLVKNAISGLLINNGLDSEVEKVTRMLGIIDRQISSLHSDAGEEIEHAERESEHIANMLRTLESFSENDAPVIEAYVELLARYKAKNIEPGAIANAAAYLLEERAKFAIKDKLSKDEYQSKYRLSSKHLKGFVGDRFVKKYAIGTLDQLKFYKDEPPADLEEWDSLVFLTEWDCRSLLNCSSNVFNKLCALYEIKAGEDCPNWTRKYPTTGGWYPATKIRLLLNKYPPTNHRVEAWYIKEFEAISYHSFYNVDGLLWCNKCGGDWKRFPRKFCV